MNYIWTEDTGAGFHFWELVNKYLFHGNVINLRKRTMPDIITPLYRVKIFGIALDMKSS